MSWAADGQDGNGLHLEKMRLSYRFCLKKFAKTLIMAHFLFKTSLDVFLLVFYKYFVYNNSGQQDSMRLLKSDHLQHMR